MFLFFINSFTICSDPWILQLSLILRVIQDDGGHRRRKKRLVLLVSVLLVKVSNIRSVSIIQLKDMMLREIILGVGYLKLVSSLFVFQLQKVNSEDLIVQMLRIHLIDFLKISIMELL